MWCDPLLCDCVIDFDLNFLLVGIRKYLNCGAKRSTHCCNSTMLCFASAMKNQCIQKVI